MLKACWVICSLKKKIYTSYIVSEKSTGSITEKKLSSKKINKIVPDLLEWSNLSHGSLNPVPFLGQKIQVLLKIFFLSYSIACNLLASHPLPLLMI